MIFVDTNYFLRLLLKDNEEQHELAKQLFLQAQEGKVKLFTSLIVIFEIYWLLTSFYKKSKEDIAKVLSDILSNEFIEIGNRQLFFEAVELYQNTKFDLEDSFNLVYAKSKDATDFKTFDKKLEKKFVNKAS